MRINVYQYPQGYTVSLPNGDVIGRPNRRMVEKAIREWCIEHRRNLGDMVIWWWPRNSQKG